LPVVWADHDRMEQVFVNLLNNAVRHNPPGTKVRVTATGNEVPEEQAVSEVVISVLDDGAGMPPELAAAPFESARRPSLGNGAGSNGNGSNGNGSNGSGSNGSGSNGQGNRKSAGAGLGLSIAMGIVQAHGGRMELTAPSKGTCFSVYLPVEAGSER
ncbi:MAG: sensor histidine kinase, partial [Streptosporangiaceae bacterium]